LEGESLRQTFYRTLIELTNGKWTSATIRKFAQSKISKKVIPSFAKYYKINTVEMEKELHQYKTLHEFFIRKLKEGVRPINIEESTVVSPVDAVIEDAGTINSHAQFVVKGKTYSIQEMLGSEDAAKKYLNGNYIILYLSPSHYHRIHSPVNGSIKSHWTLGGRSYPVNRLGLQYGKAPLSKNYRRISEIEHKYGTVAVVKVGAMFVNSIELTFKGENVKKGEEIGYFTFGSTVVLLFEKGTFQWNDMLKIPAHVKVGEVIGYLKKSDEE
jgi:phosphatidylserine decarboxylase